MTMILNPQAIRRLAYMGTRQHIDCGTDVEVDPAIGEAAKSNAAIAGRMQDLAEKQYTDQSAALEEFKPLLKDLIGKSVTAQDKAIQQSDASWASYNETWKPVEQKLAQQSLDWASPGRTQQLAQEATTGVADQFDQARTESRESMIRAGMDPSAMASLEAAGRLEEAKVKAGAGNKARRDAEVQSLGFLDNASRFGRNMTSTGLETARLASAQGSAAQGGVGGLQSAIAAPAQSAGGLFSGAVSANSAAGSLFLGQYQAQAQADAAGKAVVGDMIGAGAGAAAMYFRSSEKLKDMSGAVNPDEASGAVEKSPARRWAYKPGLGDGSTKQRMGPTAESLAAVAPEVSDGTQVDGIAMLGLHHAAIGGQSARLRAIEKKLGLADAGRA